ncbi:lysogeny maintenance protein PflM [Pseudomonas fluvialis]|uniref:lysogeny maintenance protein PflM n=1 Tax=Pseudomonas fluvialis TaxID=1793966 RepID=UPI00160FB412|nr:DUF5447 family protein [Pseudomonas fluvialis]
MNSINRYLRLSHAANCDCSVCWSRHLSPSPGQFRSAPCGQCRPSSLAMVDGSWKVIPAFLCAKHTPPLQPRKYWSVVYDSGPPTPFIPMREPEHD